MQGNMNRTLSIEDLSRKLPGVKLCPDLVSDLFLADLRYDAVMEFLRYPARFDGYLAFFCISGSFDIEINLRKYSVSDGSMVLYVPGYLVRVLEMPQEEKERLRFVVMAVSRDLMSSIAVDFTKLYEDSIRLLDNPCVRLENSERKLLKEYFDLVSEIAPIQVRGIRESVILLASSAFSLMGTLWTERLKSVSDNASERRSVRAGVIFEDFILLVREHHMRERCLTFYADKLCLSPKYLSKAVRAVSGKSAHEWINDFVVIEAKNMLKYSDLNIKTIVSELNFPNQTSFYRFFKVNTGLTPTEYRRSK